MSPSTPISPSRGPLRPHPDNPRYFAHAGGPPLYLCGSHTWANFATDQGRTRFDYESYLDALVSLGHNLVRGWTWDIPWSRQGPNGGPFRFTPSPWLRTGPGLATDGQPRFDLTALDPAYFERIARRTSLARERGLYVIIMLFQGFGWQFDRTDQDGLPCDGRNNINGIDCGPGSAAYTLEHPEVVAVQEAYVRRVVDAVADLDNVLFEIANEAGPDSTAWQVHHIEHLQAYQRTRRLAFPVGMTFQFEGGTLEALESSGADWISPDCDPDTRSEPPVLAGRQVVIYDSDHGYDWRSLRTDGPDGYRSWVWRTFCRGGSAMLMDPWLAHISIDGETRNAPLGHDPDEPYFGLERDPFWELYRAIMGTVRSVSERIDLAHMVPRPELSTTGYCLAAPGQEYLVYAPTPGGAIELDLEAGGYQLTWLDAATGGVMAEPVRLAGAGPTGLVSPGTDDVVAHLVRASGPVVS